MKGIIFLLLSFVFFNCATTKPQLPKIEYSGPDLEWNSEYEITQMESSETMFMITSSNDEKVLLNIYKSDGTLLGTLYEGNGGILITSLAIIMSKYDLKLPPGDYVMILFGERGKTLFKLKTV